MPKYLGDIRFSRPDVIKDDGFIYGSLVVADGKYFICTYAVCSHKTFVDNTRATMFEVIPETVGEYTGLTDKNGKKIFEGDIVKHHVQGDILVNLGVVNWDEENARWAYKLNTMNPCFALYDPNAFEVIGNIHNNPELLNGGGNNDT